jgi:hypothetical protein
MTIRVDNKSAPSSVIIAVPFDALDELQREGLASPLPVLRGAGIEALVTIGMDSAALVTLLQAPDTIRTFADWIRARCERKGNTIEISARRGDRRVHLTVHGDLDIGVIAEFLIAVFAEDRSQA